MSSRQMRRTWQPGRCERSAHSIHSMQRAVPRHAKPDSLAGVRGVPGHRGLPAALPAALSPCASTLGTNVTPTRPVQAGGLQAEALLGGGRGACHLHRPLHRALSQVHPRVAAGKNVSRRSSGRGVGCRGRRSRSSGDLTWGACLWRAAVWPWLLHLCRTLWPLLCTTSLHPSARLPAHPPACSNPWSVHEVHVDEEQLQFFKEKLEAAQVQGAAAGCAAPAAVATSWLPSPNPSLHSPAWPACSRCVCPHRC